VEKLSGSITPQGAKNEALQILCAVLLTNETVTIGNIPDILDVNLLIELLHDMGVQVNKINAHTYSFTANNVDENHLASDAFRKKVRLRGSVMLAGPMLARFKKHIFQSPVEIKLEEEDWIHISLVLKN
jgi:UDP-N-acetylglucosamine 1-carboxyvinyltransferase